MIDDKLTYISLFSSAGVGCYGFKLEDYICIATNELIERRLNVQRNNKKCMLDSGYIGGDITLQSTKDLIFSEIKKWSKKGNDSVDVVIATPPCQGMSVANHKKTTDEIVRNSLVVESIQIIQQIKPKFFIFENVPAFLKTACTAPNGSVQEIRNVIAEELGSDYIFYGNVINFKNYGSNSSRTRTLVIGVNKKYQEFITPVELFPAYQEEKTLVEVLQGMTALQWGEFDSNDFYHQYRTYPEEMRCWIHDLKEGESAFDNTDENKRPHKVIDGQIVPNQRKNGDKYTRQCWNKVAPCIHTRNDQLASQNTVHPSEDRVFSIRELMRIMTIPFDFRWIDMSLEELNSLPYESKRALLKKEEINIRQSIGEAVPTEIFRRIASNIKSFMLKKHLTDKQIDDYIKDNKLILADNLIACVENNPDNLCIANLSKIVELANSLREQNSAYFTNKFILNEIYMRLPEIDKETISIIEPAVGIGNFIPFIAKKYESKKAVYLDVYDIDAVMLDLLRKMTDYFNLPKNIHINYIHSDSILHEYDKHYDLMIGNPPFTKLKSGEPLISYQKNAHNKKSYNLFSYFLEVGLRISDYIVMITPKNLLNTPEFTDTRKQFEDFRFDCIIDFGEYGFKGVLIETICSFIDVKARPGKVEIVSLPQKKTAIQKQNYIFDTALPYWMIYRNSLFDEVCKKMNFGIFSVFRDRQITNTLLKSEKANGIRVIKSRNIAEDGSGIIDIDGYDSFVDEETAKSLSVYKYLDDTSVYLVPNMTYKPRMIKKGLGYIVNGSVAVLILNGGEAELSDDEIRYFATDEYREFYRVARNYQTRTLNIDANSVFLYGRLRRKDCFVNQDTETPQLL